MARKYLVTEDEFKSATITPEGELEFTRDNGEKVNAGKVTAMPAVHTQSVAGAVSIAVIADHLYELTATSVATVTLTGAAGSQVAIRWSGSAGTVAGQAVSDGQTWVAVRWASGWVLYEVGGSGGGPGPDPEPEPTGAYQDAVLADSPTHLLMMTDTAGATVPARLGSGTGAITAAGDPVTFGGAALGDIPSSATFPGAGAGFFIDDATFAGATVWSAEAVVNLSTPGGIVSLISSIDGQIGNTLGGGYASGCGGTVFGSSGTNVTRHIALVCDGATVTFYVNGAQSGTPVAATAAVGAAAKIFIGGQTPGSQPSAGQIAGVAIYKTALTQARVLAHATAAGVV